MVRHWLALFLIRSESRSGFNSPRTFDPCILRRTQAPKAQPSNRSSTTAIPSSSFEDVTSSATAFSSSWASAMATP